MITRRTLIDDIAGISVRAHRQLRKTGCETVAELLDLFDLLDLVDPDGKICALIGDRTIRELARALPEKWRASVLDAVAKPPPKPPRKPPADASKVHRVRVHCTRCGHVSSVMAHRADEPCSHCSGKVERRSKGRPRKQADAV